MKDMKERIEEIFSRCEGNVCIEYNPHKSSYCSVKSYLEFTNSTDTLDISPEAVHSMIEEDTIVSLQWYPDTPVGFYIVHASKIEDCIQQCLDIMNDEDYE